MIGLRVSPKREYAHDILTKNNAERLATLFEYIYSGGGMLNTSGCDLNLFWQSPIGKQNNEPYVDTQFVYIAGISGEGNFFNF